MVTSVLQYFALRFEVHGADGVVIEIFIQSCDFLFDDPHQLSLALQFFSLISMRIMFPLLMLF